MNFSISFSGKLLASKISEKSVAFSGGILFLIFAATALYGGVEQ